MRIEELVIDGFKSYSVRTVISNWDPQFNAITGLNGSGKSNILDAICFVLGISSMSTVRANNLQDLIYKRGQAGVTKASVTITFDNSDPSSSPLNYKDHAKISVTRQVMMGSASKGSETKYLINGRKKSQLEVWNLFQSIQLNINNPNFLIMQGKITKMLNMKPKEVLNLIEEAAGTKMYEGQRAKSVKIMEKKNATLRTTEHLLDVEVEPRLAQLQEQKSVVVDYQNLSLQKENLTRALAASDYSHYINEVEEINAHMEEKKNLLDQSIESIKILEEQIDKLDHDIIEIKEQNVANKSEESKKLEELEQSLANELTRLETARDLKTQNYNELKQSIEIKMKKIQNTDKVVNENKEKYKSTETEFLKEEERLKGNKEILQKKEDLLSTLSTGISSKGTDSGYASHLRDANKKLSETKSQIEQDKLKIRHLSSETDLKKLGDKKKDIQKLQNELDKKKRHCEILQEKMRQCGFDKDQYDHLNLEQKELVQKLNQANSRLQDFRRHDSRFDFTYEPPFPNFNSSSVKGLCGELFNLPESNANSATALEVCAGGKLFNVVVDTDNTGSQLLEKGKLRRRVTIVPLNKITAKVINPNALDHAKTIAPNKVELALNLVEYDDSVLKAMEYVFGNKLICNDPDTAKKVTFDPQVRTGSITLEGDNYDPEGRLSGGSRKSSNSTIFTFIKYRSLKDEVDKIRYNLDVVTEKLKRMSKAINQTSEIQQELRAEQYHVSTLEKKLTDSPSAKYIQSYEIVTQQTNELEKRILDNTLLVEQYVSEIAQIERDMSEFNSDGSKKLRELEIEIQNMKISLNEQEAQLSEKRRKFQGFKVRNDDFESDISKLKEELIKSENNVLEIEQEFESVKAEIEKKQLEHDRVDAIIREEKERNAGIAAELKEISKVLNEKKEQLSSAKLLKEKNDEKLKECRNNLRLYNDRMKKIQAENNWVSEELLRNNVIEQHPNLDLDECHSAIDRLDNRLQALRQKGADENVLQEIEIYERHARALTAKIKQINKDKEKIEATITKLDDYKKEELRKTYQKVSKDFGEIFSSLLPHSYSKLVLTNPNDITEGLEVRVQLGNVWKESLVELSGGQRSLVALALIMSLLQFKPAPMYILDEVDAALDLSHTQSIGHLIKTKFKGSQFIVVSLKEGMFTNANRLFKVRFQEGTSVVTAT